MVGQTTTSVMLQWDKVNDITQYNVSFCNPACKTESLTWSGNSPVNYTVSALNAAREYSMTLYTCVNGFCSTGYGFNATTGKRHVALAQTLHLQATRAYQCVIFQLLRTLQISKQLTKMKAV